MRYKFINKVLNDKKFLFSIIVAFIFTGLVEFWILSTFIEFFNVNRLEAKYDYSIYFKFNYFINISIILSITYLVFKFFKTKNFKTISLTIGLTSSIILSLINFLFTKQIHYFLYLDYFTSITALILVWIIISESQNQYLKNVTLGFFMFIFIQELINLTEKITTGYYDWIDIISPFFISFFYVFIFQIPISISRQLLKKREATTYNSN